MCEASMSSFLGKVSVRKSLSSASLHGEVNYASIHSLTHSQADLFHSVRWFIRLSLSLIVPRLSAI